jgi:hypothetical protein
MKVGEPLLKVEELPPLKVEGIWLLLLTLLMFEPAPAFRAAAYEPDAVLTIFLETGSCILAVQNKNKKQ